VPANLVWLALKNAKEIVVFHKQTADGIGSVDRDRLRFTQEQKPNSSVHFSRCKQYPGDR
jgi:hypothetical protein